MRAANPERVQQGAGGVYCGQGRQSGRGTAPLGGVSSGGETQGGDHEPVHSKFSSVLTYYREDL